MGQERSFWVLDVLDLEARQVQAVLRHVGERALWYIASDVQVPPQKLEEASVRFDEEVYPLMTGLFGGGRDLGGRLTILHAPLQGAAGYMSSIDRHPASVHPASNKRDMLYIDSRADFGVPSHLGTLTHELQHVVHGWADPDEETWINEGLSELAAWLGGFPALPTGAFLSRPDTSLVRWPDTPLSALPNYAGALLFMRYLLEQTGEEQLDLLVAEPSDGIAGMEAYLNTAAPSLSFDDLYAGWAVDNYASQEFIQPSSPAPVR